MKKGCWDFREGLTQIGLYSLRNRLEAYNFVFKKQIVLSE